MTHYEAAMARLRGRGQDEGADSGLVDDDDVGADEGSGEELARLRLDVAAIDGALTQLLESTGGAAVMRVAGAVGPLRAAVDVYASNHPALDSMARSTVAHVLSLPDDPEAKASAAISDAVGIARRLTAGHAVDDTSAGRLVTCVEELEAAWRAYAGETVPAKRSSTHVTSRPALVSSDVEEIRRHQGEVLARLRELQTELRDRLATPPVGVQSSALGAWHTVERDVERFLAQLVDTADAATSSHEAARKWYGTADALLSEVRTAVDDASRAGFVAFVRGTYVQSVADAIAAGLAALAEAAARAVVHVAESSPLLAIGAVGVGIAIVATMRRRS